MEVSGRGLEALGLIGVLPPRNRAAQRHRQGRQALTVEPLQAGTLPRLLVPERPGLRGGASSTKRSEISRPSPRSVEARDPAPFSDPRDGPREPRPFCTNFRESEARLCF
ncbi:unnamed protein product [Ixodes pacificus]